MSSSAGAAESTLAKALEDHYEAHRKKKIFYIIFFLYSHILFPRFSQNFMWILIEKNKSMEWQNHEGNLNYFICTKDKSCGITSTQLTEWSCEHMLLIKPALSYIVTNGTTCEQLLQELSIKISCIELMWNHLQSFVFSSRLQIRQLPACQENSIEHNQHLETYINYSCLFQVEIISGKMLAYASLSTWMASHFSKTWFYFFGRKWGSQ